MMGQLVRDRGVQASVFAGAILATLSARQSLPWPLWAAWAAASAAAVVYAVRSPV